MTGEVGRVGSLPVVRRREVDLPGLLQVPGQVTIGAEKGLRAFHQGPFAVQPLSRGRVVQRGCEGVIGRYEVLASKGRRIVANLHILNKIIC